MKHWSVLLGLVVFAIVTTCVPTVSAQPRCFDETQQCIVQAVCSGGTDLGANEIGTGQIEAVIEFQEGPCFWDVDADGTWNFQPK